MFDPGSWTGLSCVSSCLPFAPILGVVHLLLYALCVHPVHCCTKQISAVHCIVHDGNGVEYGGDGGGV